jgi:hypothetical protein
LEHEHNEGDHEQQVNKSSGDMESKAKRPKNNENNENGPEHIFILQVEGSRNWGIGRTREAG